MNDVHLFEDDGAWVVAAQGSEQRFGSRPEAFRAAKARARDLNPSRIVNGVPDVRASAAAPAPSVRDDAGGAAADDDPALAHLGPKARAALLRAREADASGAADDAGWAEGGPVWDGDDGDSGDGDADGGFGGVGGVRGGGGRPGSRGASGARPLSTCGGSARPTPDRPRRDPADDEWTRPVVEAVLRAPDWTAWDAGDQGWSWSRLAGPAALGRSIILDDTAEVPEPWAGCDEVLIGADDLDDPDVLAQVRDAFLTRTPVVYRLEDPELAPVPASITTDVWKVPVDLEVGREVLWHLLLANSVDARDPDAPVWPLARAAREAGASRSTTADVALLDGRVAWCDGGPLRFWPGGRVAADDGTEAVVIPRVTVDAGRLDPSSGDQPEADLAPDQLESVGDAAARSRIVAPAGSGKTRVLTERARYLIRSQQVPATVGLPRRVQQAGPGGDARPHARPPRPADPDPQRPGAGDPQRRRHLPVPRRAGHDARRARGAAAAVGPGQVPPPGQHRSRGGVARRARRWSASGCATRPRSRPSSTATSTASPPSSTATARSCAGGVRSTSTTRSTARSRRCCGNRRHAAAAQASCRVLLVDEFQDLTPAHLLLIRLLAGPEADVFGVGDDDQTIYGYSGASPDWLIEFDRYFPGATHHALEVNYRCPEAVVTAASNLLSHNRRRVAKEIRPGPHATAGDAIHVVTHEQPVVATAATITELVHSGVPASDIIVLSRVNTLLAPVQVALHEAGIPVLNREGGRFLERTGVAAALSWIRLATRPSGLGGADIERAARRPGPQPVARR